MAEEPAVTTPVYDAIVGDPSRLTSSSSGAAPPPGRVRIVLGGELASKAYATDLAAEILALIEDGATSPTLEVPESDPDPVEVSFPVRVSLRGLGPDHDKDPALVQRIREHIVARLARERDAGIDTPPQGSGR